MTYETSLCCHTPRGNWDQGSVIHQEAHFLKVPRESGIREPLGILEHPGQGLITLPLEASPEPLVTRAAGRGSWVVGSHIPGAPGPHYQAACFFPLPVHFCLRGAIQAGSRPCPDLGRGEPTTVFVTMFL